MTPHQMTHEELQALAQESQEKLSAYVWRRLRFEGPLDPPVDQFRRQEPPEEFILEAAERSHDAEFAQRILVAVDCNLDMLFYRFAHEREGTGSTDDQHLASLALISSVLEARQLLPKLELLIAPWLATWRTSCREPTDGQFHVLRLLAQLQEGAALAPVWRDIWQSGPASLKGLIIFAWARADPSEAMLRLPQLADIEEEIDLPTTLLSLFQEAGLGRDDFIHASERSTPYQRQILLAGLQECEAPEEILEVFAAAPKDFAIAPSSKDDLTSIIKRSHLGITEEMCQALRDTIAEFACDTRDVQSPVSIHSTGRVGLSMQAYGFLAGQLAPHVECAIHVLEEPRELKGETKFHESVIGSLQTNGWIGYALRNDQWTRTRFATWRELVGRDMAARLTDGDIPNEFVEAKTMGHLARLEYLPLHSEAHLKVNQSFFKIASSRFVPLLGFIGHENDEGVSDFVVSMAPSPSKADYDRVIEDVCIALRTLSLDRELLSRYGVQAMTTALKWMQDSGCAGSGFYDEILNLAAKTLEVPREELLSGIDKVEDLQTKKSTGPENGLRSKPGGGA